MATPREDAAVFMAIERTISEANRLFFGAFAPMRGERGTYREAWESRVAELRHAQDLLWNRHDWTVSLHVVEPIICAPITPDVFGSGFFVTGTPPSKRALRRARRLTPDVWAP